MATPHLSVCRISRNVLNHRCSSTTYQAASAPVVCVCFCVHVCCVQVCCVVVCPVVVCCVVCIEAVCLEVKCNRVWLNTARDEMRVQICLVNCQQLGVLLVNTCLLGSLHKTHWSDLPGKSQFSHQSLCWWISTISAWHCNNGHLWISDRTMLIFADGNVCNILAIFRLIFVNYFGGNPLG